MQLWARQGITAAQKLFQTSYSGLSCKVGLQSGLRFLHHGQLSGSGLALRVAAGVLTATGIAAVATLPQDADRWSWSTPLALRAGTISNAKADNCTCGSHAGSSDVAAAESISTATSSSSSSSSSSSITSHDNSGDMGSSQQGSGGASDRPLPVVKAALHPAPHVPAPINRAHAVRMQVELTSTCELVNVSLRHKYPAWVYNGAVPGPMIRCRVGDELEVSFTNLDRDGIGHNIDFHCVTGPGGGAPVLYAEQGETKSGVFKMLYPGLFVYHCAAAPVPMHVANGMYGLFLVEPADGLPKVDKEFYVLQSEFYAEDDSTATETLEPSYWEGLRENPTYVVFNGREGALTEQPLLTEQGDRVRLFVGNAGPNLVSSFHIIGCIFDKVYREGDLMTAPARGVQTTLIPAGGAAVLEVDLPVPGNYTLVDHSIFRMDKGAVGFLKVKPGLQEAQVQQADAVYHFEKRPFACPGCKLHG